MKPRAQTDRASPSSIAAEKYVLDAIMIDESVPNQTFLLTMNRLGENDFFFAPHKQIVRAMAEITQRGMPISELSLRDELGRNGSDADLIACVSQIGNGMPRINQLDHYVGIVKRDSLFRRLAHSAEATRERALAGADDVKEVAKAARDSIDNILAEAQTVGRPSQEVEMGKFANIQKAQLEYLWPNYLPLGRLVHLAGNSGEGKSPLAIDIVARTSSGKEWPDGTVNNIGPRSAILLMSEDDAADTIRPRLELAGANLDKVFKFSMHGRRGTQTFEKMLSLDTDLAVLVENAKKIPDLALVVIDPITNYLGRAKMNQEEDIRALLMPVAIAAKDLRVTFITIGHLNRREPGTESLHRIMGAAAFHGIARFIYMAGPDPESDSKHAHILVQRRGVDAPTLRYHTEAVRMEWKEEPSGVERSSDVVRVMWNGVSRASAEDAVDPRSKEEKSTNARAASALIEILRDGRKTKEQALDALGDAGFDTDKLNVSRLLEAASAKSDRFKGERHYSWYLPSSEKGERP